MLWNHSITIIFGMERKRSKSLHLTVWYSLCQVNPVVHSHLSFFFFSFNLRLTNSHIETEYQCELYGNSSDDATVVVDRKHSVIPEYVISFHWNVYRMWTTQIFYESVFLFSFSNPPETTVHWTHSHSDAFHHGMTTKWKSFMLGK